MSDEKRLGWSIADQRRLKLALCEMMNYQLCHSTSLLKRQYDELLCTVAGMTDLANYAQRRTAASTVANRELSRRARLFEDISRTPVFLQQ
jgi:hypothetical protein